MILYNETALGSISGTPATSGTAYNMDPFKQGDAGFDQKCEPFREQYLLLHGEPGAERRERELRGF